ncbi:HNH endonuclease [Lacisediminihabitans changchengi]|uniref:HNH endonuclease n=1 Tax=Lacisediminihabitans changchengi TaxID=2787634 RepID=A0A934W2U3_9MICO|nr:HNH endonuclease [Lacisediminihabitans changchengi]MBK4348258.1 HNH endonuclease [Lacisediminihabitans changchengi]
MSQTQGEKPVVRQSSVVRVAAYVASVGEGNKFKKLDLFKAVEGVAQADRRMRDLRTMGWKIDNYKMNPSLLPDEYLIRAIGTRVDLGAKAPVSRKSISGPKRRRIIERDGHACQVCGSAAGAEFADAAGRFAMLSIGHIIPVARGGGDEDDNLRAECQRCNDESRDVSIDPPTAAQVITEASNAGGIKEKRVLYNWMAAGRRSVDDKERIFNMWARLPEAQRREAMAALAEQVIKLSN